MVPTPAEPFLILGIYCAVIVVSSLMGGALPQLVRLTHKRMQMVTSLVSGLMLGIALFHLLPHGINELPLIPTEGEGFTLDVERGIWWLVTGLVFMFFMLRMFHFHDHSAAEVDGSGYPPQHDCQHDHDHDHDHGHSPHAKDNCDRHAHKLSWVGVFFGLSIHTLIDGIALGASVQAAAAHSPSVTLVGFGTFLAILLHKPLDAVSITGLMSASGWSTKSRHLVNICYSLMCPLGAFLFMLGMNSLGETQSAFLGCTLTFAAGVFLSISLVDLLPELEFHSHDRLKLSVMLLLGLTLAYGIGYLEPAHTHQPPSVKEPHEHHDHQHHEHDKTGLNFRPVETHQWEPTANKFNRSIVPATAKISFPSRIA